jgi:hypothetical protein
MVDGIWNDSWSGIGARFEPSECSRAHRPEADEGETREQTGYRHAQGGWADGMARQAICFSFRRRMGSRAHLISII